MFGYVVDTAIVTYLCVMIVQYGGAPPLHRKIYVPEHTQLDYYISLHNLYIFL